MNCARNCAMWKAGENMGLDTTHDCWHGAYSAFNRWRTKLAQVAGLPPLELMEGFFHKDTAVTGNPFWESYNQDRIGGHLQADSIWMRLPISWDCLKPDPLHELLHHSDCEGEIEWQRCAAIADSLERLLPKLPTGEDRGHIGNWKDKTEQFITGLRAAHKAKENVEFH